MKNIFHFLFIVTAFIISSCGPSLLEMKQELDGIKFFRDSKSRLQQLAATVNTRSKFSVKTDVIYKNGKKYCDIIQILFDAEYNEERDLKLFYNYVTDLASMFTNGDVISRLSSEKKIIELALRNRIYTEDADGTIFYKQNGISYYMFPWVLWEKEYEKYWITE